MDKEENKLQNVIQKLSELAVDANATYVAASVERLKANTDYDAIVVVFRRDSDKFFVLKSFLEQLERDDDE